MKNCFIFTILLLVLNSCLTYEEMYDDRLRFCNNSDTSVYVVLADYYIDSAYVNVNYNHNHYKDKYLLRAESEMVYSFTQGSWEKIEKSKDIVSFYFVDSIVLKTNDWQKIKEEYLVVDRYDFSYIELDSLDWVVEFP